MRIGMPQLVESKVPSSQRPVAQPRSKRAGPGDEHRIPDGLGIGALRRAVEEQGLGGGDICVPIPT